MRIYFALTEGFDPALALAPGRRRGAGSAAAWSLLLWALRREGLARELPEIAAGGRGKPYFSRLPGIHFSLSHTRGVALCALGERPSGADVQRIDPKDSPFAAGLMSEAEREDFTLHELWCLRESVYKLTGEGSLRSMRFRREGAGIVPPVGGVACRLYPGVPGCAAAGAAFTPEELPASLIEAPAAELQKAVVIPGGG